MRFNLNQFEKLEQLDEHGAERANEFRKLLDDTPDDCGDIEEDDATKDVVPAPAVRSQPSHAASLSVYATDDDSMPFADSDESDDEQDAWHEAHDDAEADFDANPEDHIEDGRAKAARVAAKGRDIPLLPEVDAMRCTIVGNVPRLVTLCSVPDASGSDHWMTSL